MKADFSSTEFFSGVHCVLYNLRSTAHQMTRLADDERGVRETVPPISKVA